MTGYICQTCGTEHDTIPKAMACFDSHQAEAGEIIEVEPAVEDGGEDATPEPGWVAPAAPELLGRAALHMHERSSTYDKPEGERSMGRAVAAFNAITGHKLTESEGWLLLQVLKDVRNFSREKPHQDSLEDCIAYSALKAEAEMRRLSGWVDR